MAKRRYKFKYLSYDHSLFYQGWADEDLELTEVGDSDLAVIGCLIPKEAWRSGIYYISLAKEHQNLIDYPKDYNAFVYYQGDWFWYKVWIERDLYSYREPTPKEWAAMNTLVNSLGLKSLNGYLQKVYQWWRDEYELGRFRLEAQLDGYKFRKRYRDEYGEDK